MSAPVRLSRAGLLRAAAASTAASALLAAGRPGMARAVNRSNSDPATPNDRAGISFLTLAEQLQIALYEAGSGVELARDARAYVAEALEQERSHLVALQEVNRLHRIEPDRPPSYQFGFPDQQSYLETLKRVEDAVVSGYGGVAVAIEFPSVYLVDLVPIVADEMTHAATLALLLDLDAPRTFTDPRPPADVQPILDDPTNG